MLKPHIHKAPSAVLHFAIAITLAISLFSCSDSKPKKFKYAGGTFTFAIENDPTTFSPKDASDLYSVTLLYQIYEGLVGLNPQTLDIEPRLAKDWVVSEDGKKVEFTLRDDVFFHTHSDFEEPVQFTPEDVIFSIELACSPIKGKESYAYSTIYKEELVGAKEFYNQETDHIEGLTVQGNTVTFNLLEKDLTFIEKLAQAQASIVSKEIVASGHELSLLGTGPFKFSTYEEIDGRNHIILVKNEAYYEKDENGCQLPYLDSLVLLVENKSLKQLELFENEKIQLIESLPASKISTMLGEGKIKDFNGTPPKLNLIRKPLLSTHYLHFNLLKEEFQDVRVRQAFNYAINRNEIVQNLLNNQAYSIGSGGIVPPAVFNGYNSELVQKNAYTYKPKKAQALLAKAGYPNGKDFPDISIKYSIGQIPSAVADEVSKQLKNILNINVNMDGMPFKTLLEDEQNANGELFKTAWVADYFSPESFLINGYGKAVPDSVDDVSVTNYSRYQNPQFDFFYEKAKSSDNILDQYENFAKAESILMEDAPFIILWYEETIKIAYSKVRNLHLNAMSYYSFKDVYIKEWTKKEWEEQIEN